VVLTSLATTLPKEAMKKILFFLVITMPIFSNANQWKPFFNGFEIDEQSINVEDNEVSAWLFYHELNSYDHITVNCEKKENRLINFSIKDGKPIFHQQKNKDNYFKIKPNTLGEKLFKQYCKQ
jgi:hypothetical protein